MKISKRKVQCFFEWLKNCRSELWKGFQDPFSPSLSRYTIVEKYVYLCKKIRYKKTLYLQIKKNLLQGLRDETTENEGHVSHFLRQVIFLYL